MKDGDLLLLKVPQVIIARKLRRGGVADNGTYLDAGIFRQVEEFVLSSSWSTNTKD